MESNTAKESSNDATKDREIVPLTPEQAKEIVAVRKNGMVHTFYNPGFGLIGGDHSFKSICKDIDSAQELQITGSQAQAMGHGLAVIPCIPCKQSEILFVETNKEKIKEYLSDDNGTQEKQV